MLSMFKKIYDICKDVVKEFYETSCSTRAAGLAYTTLLSIVPMMSVGLAVISAFPVYKEAGSWLQGFIFKNFVAGSADVIQHQLESFAAQAASLSPTGIFFLFITAVLMIFTMENTFNTIWHVKERRHGVTAFLMYWAVLTLLPILIGVGFAVSSYFFSLPFISKTTVALRRPLLKMLPYVLTWGAFSFLYVALPNRKIYLRHAAVGALIATLFFELAKYGFGLYILYFPTYELIYGALATIPVFLVWVYVSWTIILFGAVIAHVLAKKPETFT